MAKYSKKAQEKVEKSMHEFKHGKLKSGSGAKVKSRKQAIAIGISEAREAGAKVPPAKSSTSSAKKSTPSSTKKTARRKSTTKKAATKKSSTRKKS